MEEPLRCDKPAVPGNVDDGVMLPMPPAPVTELAPGDPTRGIFGSCVRVDVGVGGEDTAPVSWLVRVEICIGTSLGPYALSARGDRIELGE